MRPALRPARSGRRLGRCRHVTGSGLTASLETWEAVPVDYDGDGDQDVWVGYHDQGGRLFSNNGKGDLHPRGAERLAEGERGRQDPRPARLCDWADINLDGLADAYCAAGRGGQNLVKTGKDNELWLQTAVGQFSEVGTDWGIGDVCGRSHYVAFLDANGDAYPDLFVGNAPPRAVSGDPCDNPANGLPFGAEQALPQPGRHRLPSVTTWGIGGYGGSRCAEVTGHQPATAGTTSLVCGGAATQVYRNNAGTGFTDVAGANGLATTHTDAVLGDLDGDGDQDLVTAIWGRIDFRLNTGGVFGTAGQGLRGAHRRRRAGGVGRRRRRRRGPRHLRLDLQPGPTAPTPTTWCSATPG